VDAAQKEVDRRSALYQKLAALSPATWNATATAPKEELQTAEVT
jgi:hypothetical protein